MMDYLTAKQTAEEWGIFSSRVQVLCDQNLLKGAVRLGWVWAIPKIAEKLASLHKKNKNKNIQKGVRQ